MPRNRKKLTSATKLRLQQIIRLQMLDKPVENIAGLLGMTPANVTDMIAHPEYDALRKEYCEKIYAPVDAMIQKRNAGHILEDAAPDAAEALSALLTDPDPVQRRLASTAVLDRAGHGPVQRKAIRQRVELDPVSAALIGQAMSESEITVIDVEPEDATGTESR